MGKTYKIALIPGDGTGPEVVREAVKALVKAVNLDPAMMEFLDTVRNHQEVPNENYSRELQELFTLGVKDAGGNDNYAQTDVAQIARAFTGSTSSSSPSTGTSSTT